MRELSGLLVSSQDWCVCVFSEVDILLKSLKNLTIKVEVRLYMFKRQKPTGQGLGVSLVCTHVHLLCSQWYLTILWSGLLFYPPEQ